MASDSVVMISSKMASRKHVEIFLVECRRSLLGRVNSVGVEAILAKMSIPGGEVPKIQDLPTDLVASGSRPSCA